MSGRYFSQASFDFLSELAANNNRDWFNEHKQLYEDTIRTPALALITDMADELPLVSPHFLALPKKVGGSLMRVYRDTRFGKDKTPYKTNIGIQFRHEAGKDVHAPGFYLHIEPDGCFVGAGIWRPDSAALGKIRDAIVEKGDTWKKVSRDKGFNGKYGLSGETLVNSPRGYPRDHPLLADLKRKDFIAISEITEKMVTSKRMMSQVIERYKLAGPYMKFLCNALELRY
ncbi:MAG TPA: DUF2461 domain-containing protein [Gammaproteobacteria bacterium]|nr:DUF2461 domain-containing protein [Gammaproteobacteria bacterium]